MSRETVSAGDDPFTVVIVGGGVAALEAALCLHEVAGDLVSTTILAPNSEFVDLPMAVQEPFGHPAATRHLLIQIAGDAGARLCADRLGWLDGGSSVVHTRAGEQLPFDALLLAPGASVYPSFADVTTLDPRRLETQLSHVLAEIAGGQVHRLVFLIPDGPVWPLPIYELALMTAAGAREVSADLEVTIVTPEPAPLADFGDVVSGRVEQLLAAAGITTLLSRRCAVRAPGQVTLIRGPGTPADRDRPAGLRADRIIALPQLFGPHCPGVPTSAHRGFISTDRWGAVRGLERTYAAGDAVDFRIKFGGISAQQADIAAQSIARLAGAAVEPDAFRPELHAVLLTGGQPLMLDARLSGRRVIRSRVTETSGPLPRAKISARYLAPYLERANPRFSAEPPEGTRVSSRSPQSSASSVFPASSSRPA